MYEARLRILTNLTQQVRMCPTAWNLLIPDPQTIVSPQDIVSCSNYSQGCEGGFAYLVGKYGEDFGLVAEECYPYVGIDEPCNPAMVCPRLYVENYHYIGDFYGGTSPSLMMAELYANGPIAVSFEVYNDFLNYKGGVYIHDSTLDGYNPWQITNHVVAIVGWGTDPLTALPYWKVKNSWGTSWGIDGFFLILRGADECNIESETAAFTPVIN